MRRRTLAGHLLAALTQVLEAGFYLDLLCSGAGLGLAFDVFLGPSPLAPTLPRRPGLAARPRVRRRGLSSRRA